MYPQGRRYLRRVEAAKKLGISLSTLDRWTKRGIVPCIRRDGPGRHRVVLYPEDMLDRFWETLDENRHSYNNGNTR
jgi:predicted site-specific integrase-resolvase